MRKEIVSSFSLQNVDSLHIHTFLLIYIQRTHTGYPTGKRNRFIRRSLHASISRAQLLYAPISTADRSMRRFSITDHCIRQYFVADRCIRQFFVADRCMRLFCVTDRSMRAHLFRIFRNTPYIYNHILCQLLARCLERQSRLNDSQGSHNLPISLAFIRLIPLLYGMYTYMKFKEYYCSVHEAFFLQSLCRSSTKSTFVTAFYSIFSFSQVSEHLHRYSETPQRTYIYIYMSVCVFFLYFNVCYDIATVRIRDLVFTRERFQRSPVGGRRCLCFPR